MAFNYKTPKPYKNKNDKNPIILPKNFVNFMVQNKRINNRIKKSPLRNKR